MSAQMSIEEYLKSIGGSKTLTARDAVELQSGERRVLALMSDYKPHTADEICLAAGDGQTPAREGLRRLRRLRALGYEIEKIQVSNRTWHYRLKP